MNFGISAVCLFLCLGRIQANNYSEPYNCYGDVCNSESPAQFCDIVYRHCRRCDDKRSDCFTRHQTFNCTQYCYEIRYKRDVEKLRVAGCKVPPHPNNGQLVNNTTHVPFNGTLTFTCNYFYTPLYNDSVRCGEFSMWSGPLPKCESSTGVMSLSVGLIMSLLGNIVLVISLGKRDSPKETQRLLDSKKSDTTVNIFPTGPQNATCSSTEASQPQNPESPTELLKYPVEETNYTAS